MLDKMEEKIIKINYDDGCKIYFKNGDFVICRFSGAEPLLQIFADGNNQIQANEYIEVFKKLLKLCQLKTMYLVFFYYQFLSLIII